MRPGTRRVAGDIGLERRGGQDRKADVECAVGLGGVVDRGDRAIPDRRQTARIADRDERRQAEAFAVVPAFADDLRTDPGRIAERDRQWSKDGCHIAPP